MQAATVYYDVATQELAVTTYCTPSSLSTTEVVLDLCNLKPPISSPGNLISLWKETVLVVSQRDDMLWIVDISTRKVTAQFQANFTCFATAHYVVSGLVDMHFFATTPLVRCHGCAEGASRTLVTAFLTRKDIVLIEFSGRTNSFKPLLTMPIEKEVDETLEPFLSITAQHVATLCNYSPMNESLASTSVTQSHSYGVVYLHYLGEVTNSPARIPVPGTVLSVILEEDNGTDTLIIQFKTDNELETAEYAAQPLSNLWVPVKSEKTKYYLTERLGARVYQYSTKDTSPDVVQCTRPNLPCISLVELSKNCALAYRNGVFVGADARSLCVFVGSAFVKQTIAKVTGVTGTDELEFLRCALTDTFQAVVCAKVASGVHIFVVRKSRGKHPYRVVVPGKQFKSLSTSKNAIWVPIECKLLAIEKTHAYCLILSKDTCTMLATQDDGDIEICLTVGSCSTSLPFAVRDRAACLKDCLRMQPKVATIHQYLCELHSQQSSNDQQRMLTIGDEGDLEVQKLITPTPGSELITPVRAVAFNQLSNISAHSSLAGPASIIANAKMYSCIAPQMPPASEPLNNATKSTSYQSTSLCIMIFILISISIVVLVQVRKLINYGLNS
ncbi:hypothetical protein GL50803_0016428 [Giardia duodenalis]|uniref:Uncharacterized protein n=1 Tax=Giardia intestinalis (strain ATCC 50803 / WB clone C6) TaxID=184922 RepID=D3KGK3_GIAIC|nr:hypothetical protein GL50803_0016428 [Giardia intestinalis]KAE8305308.1 hypothetical protein GL50803_0016428 [Giardia intestinalis]